LRRARHQTHLRIGLLRGRLAGIPDARHNGGIRTGHRGSGADT
jgi:hypothetical protein